MNIRLNQTAATGGAGTVAIAETKPATLVAPVVLGFEATSHTGFTLSTPPAGTGYDPAYHEIYHVWVVRGQPFPAYTAPQNMPAAWNNANVAYGKKVALFFPTAGTYVVDLWCIDRNGETAIAESTSLVIADADAAYPDTQTICYSNDGGETWAGEKAGCQRVTSYAALQTAIDAGNNLRILFKRGQEYLRAETQRLRFTSAGARLNHVGAWGTGADPILHGQDSLPLFETFNAIHGTDYLTFDNIDFRGDWDASKERGYPTYSPIQFWSNDKITHFTVSNCSFSGFLLISATPGQDSACFIGYANSIVTNWQDMGMFYENGPNSWVAKCGMRIQQNVDALNGPPASVGKNNRHHNHHGSMRYGLIGHFSVSCSDMFSRNGWFSNTDQPCMRMQTNSAVGDSFLVDRVVCEGGSDIMTIAGNNGGTPENPGNLLIDKALFVGTAHTFRSFVYAENGGLTVRNMYGIMPDVPGYKVDSWSGSIYLTGEIGPDVNEDSPIQCVREYLCQPAKRGE